MAHELNIEAPDLSHSKKLTFQISALDKGKLIVLANLANRSMTNCMENMIDIDYKRLVGDKHPFHLLDDKTKAELLKEGS